ncbi:MAG: LysM peptidoglycan-binding domain-containing protein [Chloroflexi bacterium]|nr:LysM peptidoglycan-binding domain-containing protein [Chloroflexota bacterium]
MKKGLRQVLLGFLVAILSGLLIFGAITLSLSERGKKAALPALTQVVETTPTQTPTPVQAAKDTITSVPSKTTSPQKASSTPTQSGQEIKKQPSRTPSDQGEPTGVKTTPTTGHYDGEYRSFLPLAHSAQKESSAVSIQETQILATPTLERQEFIVQAGGEKSKTYCTPPRGWAVYIIRPGDTITRLSQVTGVSVARLRKINCMGSSKKLRVGKPFFIPIVPARLPAPLPFFRFFMLPREPRSPESTQPIVIITMPPEAPTAALPSLNEIPLKFIASGSRLDSSTTHLKRLFYAVI